MPHWHPWSCKVCGARQPFVPISGTGLCPEHSRQRVAENVRGLKQKRGPAWQRWRAGMAASVIDPTLLAKARELLESEHGG
jgi:hypothetical protein